MRRVIVFPVEETRADSDAVLRRLGLPEDREPSEKVLRLLDAALEAFAERASPIALVEEVSREEVGRIVAGDDAGRRPAMVLDRVLPQAGRLALFAATVGEPVCERIRILCAGPDAPAGFFLDAVASEVTARLADRLAARFGQGRRRPLDGFDAGDRDADRPRVLPYSPGYCGWPTSGQRALFVRLQTQEIGVSLNPSCLMAPIKSVSGVLIEGPAAAHRFRPDFPFCDHCATRDCLDRMRSAGEGGRAWRS